jgi:hypothetical protein
MVFRYKALQEFLAQSNKDEICLSVAQIEDICGFKLPKSSAINSWWSNSPESGHTQSRAWVDAGYNVSVSGGIRAFKKI